jgi:hypothetical protein
MYEHSPLVSQEVNELFEKIDSPLNEIAELMKGFDDSREVAMALTKLEEAVLWFNKAVVMKDQNDRKDA